FHLFPLLIPELRRQIWEHALLRPPTMVRRWNNRKFSFALRRSVPPALHVCRETRLWFIQRSNEQIQSIHKFGLVQQREGEEGYYIYIESVSVLVSTRVHHANREVDLIPEFQFSQLKQLQHLRMSWGLRPSWLNYLLHRGVNLMRRFPSLKSITLEV
ncbi:hypothetical protein F5883DRAFT_375914, partial [Diaporthe sp. PMI_573]